VLDLEDDLGQCLQSFVIVVPHAFEHRFDVRNALHHLVHVVAQRLEGRLAK